MEMDGKSKKSPMKQLPEGAGNPTSQMPDNKSQLQPTHRAQQYSESCRTL